MARTKNPNTRTRWFIKTLPTLPGVYEVQDRMNSGKIYTWFAYWNGTEFRCRSAVAILAYSHHRLSSYYGPKPLRWRGLKHKPATHPAPAMTYLHDDKFALAA